MNKTLLTMAMATILAGAALAAEPVALPKPRMDGGKPLLEAIKARQSTKTAYSDKAITTETLSTLLWAAYGVNRPDSGGRTVAAGVKSYELDVYVLLAQGAYRYDPFQHALVPVSNEDLRAAAGGKGNLKEAALELVYVADHARQEKTKPESKSIYSAVHTGFIGQNVYLFCASEGLATVFREGADKKLLGEKLKLKKDQEVMWAQTVGYAK